MKHKSYLIFSLILVFVLAYYNYFKGYADIKQPIWDEQYHIPAAEKYLEGVAFLDSHPPLGKMLLALGEYILKPNQNVDKSTFLDKNHLLVFPEGFNYSGFRFLPAMCSVLSACLFLLIFYQISGHLVISFLFTLFYVFENSFIVHSRVATTDSIQVFLILSSILYFIYTFKQKGHIDIYKYVLLAIMVGFCATVKLTGLIGVLLFIPLFIRERYKIIISFKKHSQKIKKKLILDLTRKVILVIISLTLTVCAIFYLHISLGKKNLESQKYPLPERYVKLINENRQSSLINFPYTLSVNVNFMLNYNKNVTTRLKYDREEPGSHPLTWLVGGKAPAYSYFKKKDKVVNLIPVGNPVFWLGCLLGLFLTITLVFGKFIYGIKINNTFYFSLLTSILFLYLSYMAVMLKIDRVMYLHHYYIPLFFTFILSFIIFNYLFEELLASKDRVVYSSLLLLILQSVICFYYFYPLTYRQEMSRYEFKQRMWIEAWGLEHGK